MPSGTNAVVAVLSYTGYDLEDAMIINKQAYEWGFLHGSVYKSYTWEVNEKINGKAQSQFWNVNITWKGDKWLDFKGLDQDGLPQISKLMEYGDPEMLIFDEIKKAPKYASFKDHEQARVETIWINGMGKGEPNETDVNFTIWYKWNPVIGDKFSSWHG